MTQTTTAKPIKVYIGVEAYFGSDGVMMPRAIIWKDETRYEVDRVLDIRPAPALKAGGQGDRYTLRINGKTTYVFFERSTNLTGNVIGRWFAERRVS